MNMFRGDSSVKWRPATPGRVAYGIIGPADGLVLRISLETVQMLRWQPGTVAVLPDTGPIRPLLDPEGAGTMKRTCSMCVRAHMDSCPMDLSCRGGVWTI